MRTGNIIDGLFWGGLLILFGIFFILRHTGKIDVSFGFVFRIVAAIFFIYLGVRIFFGGFGYKDKSTAVFTDSEMVYEEGRNEYGIVFGKGMIDLAGVTVDGKTKSIEVNTVFGQGKLILPASEPIRVTMTSAFGTISAPDGSAVTFTEKTITHNYTENAPHISFRVNAVFGQCAIVYAKDSSASTSPTSEEPMRANTNNVTY